MSRRKSIQRLVKFMTYVLGRKPEEFGLVPDSNGFVKVKEFLKALSEEEGFKYVRKSHLDEILIVEPEPPIEIRDNLIRATFREHLPQQVPAQNLPKILFTCVRRRTYPVVHEKGIFPIGHVHVILSSCRDMAQRIGRRMDPTPVLLTVQTEPSIKQGTVFCTAGESLFLAQSIPSGCFSGPPLPKSPPAPVKRETVSEPAEQRLPGTYLVDLEATKNRQYAIRRKNKAKEDAWGKGAKQSKKHKRKRERPPWRS